MSKIIAIDLGSTLSEVSVMEAGTPTIIVNDEGSRTTPSVVSFADGERKVGSAAKRQMVMKPKETVNLIKRFMGCTFDEVQEDIKHVQYNVVNENGYPRIVIGDKKYSPEEISAMIVGKMKDTALSPGALPGGRARREERWNARERGVSPRQPGGHAGAGMVLL